MLFALGIELFDAGLWFEAHEPWEEIWRSDRPQPRELFQGLVQAAAGLHIWHQRRRAAAASRMLGRAIDKLSAFAPSTLGVELEELVASLREWRRWLDGAEGPPPDPPRIGAAGKRSGERRGC